MMDKMKKLKLLTEEMLREPLQIKDISSDKTMITYETEGENQSCMGFGLFKDPKQIAIQRVFMSSDTVMAEHSHEVIEWMICYAGEIKVSIFDNCGNLELEKVLVPGNGMYIRDNQIHRVEAKVDSWVVAITVPADVKFPEGI